jgi:glycosyltransferase involved in cell wall biosynthesis
LHLNNSVAANQDWMLAALLSNIKCITHERAIYSEYPRLSKLLAPQLDRVICISEAVRSNLTKCGIASKNIVIYNGIDPQSVKVELPPLDIKHEHNIKDNAVTIGVVGNIKSWKGQKSIISALPTIIAKHSNVICMLIGDTSHNDISYRQVLAEIISKFKLENHVVFTGYRKNVFDYINALDVMIHTSIEPEPFGRVLIEAMAMKTPLIGARAGAVPEIILNKETGLTFEPHDAQELANSVIFILDNPDKALKMSEAGYRRLHENFQISENTRKTEELYDYLLS